MFWLYQFIFGFGAFIVTRFRKAMAATLTASLAAAFIASCFGASATCVGLATFGVCSLVFMIAAIRYGIGQINRVK